MIRSKTIRYWGDCWKGLFLFLLLCCASYVKAADVDLGKLELGKVYEIGGFQSYKGTFTPDKNGYLQVYSTSTNTLEPFKEMKATVGETVSITENAIATSLLRTQMGKGYEIAVEAGKTYNFCADFVMNDGEVTFAMEDRTMSLFSMTPAEGSAITPTKSCNVSVAFVRMPQYESAALTVNGEQVAMNGRLSTITNSINFDLKDVLMQFFEAGKCKEGDDILLEVKGVKTADGEMAYGADGTYKASFKVGSQPTMLIKQTHTSGTFLTYYEPNDPEGKVILEFNKDIKSANAELRYGDSDQADNGGFYTEDLKDKLTIDGNKIIIDLSGKRRTVADMVSSTVTDRGEELYKTITLGVSNVVDVDGNKTYSTSSSTGKYYFTYDLDTPETNVGAEFTPETGSSIDTEDHIEIWIQDEDKLIYSGVDFTYYDNEVEKVITVTDYTKTADEYVAGAVTLNVPIPAAVKGMGEVTVTLHNLTCIDGVDHSKLLTAVYNSTATGIQGIYAEGASAQKVYYRLDGTRLAGKPSVKGIYIVNGKKVVK